MVRTYIPKRKKPEINEDDMTKAVKAVLHDKIKLREAASIYNINHSSLFYRIKKEKKNLTLKSDKFSTKYTTRQVFSSDQEAQLEKYILKCSQMNYGLTYMQIRKLAYDFAKILKCNYPSNWDGLQLAGIDWLKGFMKRHKTLSLRKPENTSLSRGTSFNQTNIIEFQNNLARALQSHNFSPERIYNLDETSVTTVVQAPNVVAKTGVKQVGQAVSAERGTLITMCAIVNAGGNTVPPVFIFPHARMHDSLMKGAPNGSLGLNNSPKSGWMTGELFMKTLEHLKKHTRCSKDDPILLLIDNHESHCTLGAVIYCKENGITMVTFPPHCTHRLQPLDVSVLGPFKSKLSVAQNDWLISNPGCTITIHNLAEICNVAYQSSFTMKNIISGFKKPGIWPFCRNAFNEDDFDCASVTDRPNPTSYIAESLTPTPHSSDSTITTTDPPPEDLNDPVKPTTSSAAVTPEIIRPYPKAKPRLSNKGRPKAKSRILTETPEKDRIAAATLARLEKKKIVRPKLLDFKQKRKHIKIVKTIVDSSSDSDNYSVHDDSDPLNLSDIDDDIPVPLGNDLEFECLKENLNVNDFVLVQFTTKSSKKYFVGQIESKDVSDYLIKFMRKKEDNLKFYFPETTDNSLVSDEDIVLKLPQPSLIGGTMRAVASMTFSVDLSKYNIG